eukprot:34847_1
MYDFSGITSVPKTMVENNIKDMFSKYGEKRPLISKISIENWTDFDIVISLIDYLVNKASANCKKSPASWQFIEYFRRYCRDVKYDGSLFYEDSQKLTRGSVCIAKVNAQYGVLFHDLKRMLNDWSMQLHDRDKIPQLH